MLLPTVTKIALPLLLVVSLGSCASSRFAVVKTDTEAQQERLLQTTELVGLPPLPQSRAAVYDYYKLGFLHDKYPGKYVSGTLVPHPIYGVYVINDYLNSFKETGNTSNLHAAVTVADAAISRMVLENEMLLFFYEPDWHLTSTSHRYVSGLTQSHYLDQLSRLAQHTGEHRFTEAAELVLQSLDTTVEKGGCLTYIPTYGPAIEESPDRPRDLVLNGWLTSLRNIHRYIQRSNSKKAQCLFDRNIDTLKQLLPLYDAADLANSRYRLRGYIYVNIIFNELNNQIIKNALLHIPNEGEFKINGPITSRWDFGFTRGVEFGFSGAKAIERRVQLNLVVSLISTPAPNCLTFDLISDGGGVAEIFIAEGEYDPLATGMKTEKWQSVGEYRFTQGDNQLSIDIPISIIDKAVYPTNFLKKINNKNYNAYHFVHIDGLEFIGKTLDYQPFVNTAVKWSSYVDRWKLHPLYMNQPIEFDRYVAPKSENKTK